jgi:hypothetical protein
MSRGTSRVQSPVAGLFSLLTPRFSPLYVVGIVRVFYGVCAGTLT